MAGAVKTSRERRKRRAKRSKEWRNEELIVERRSEEEGDGEGEE